MLMLWLEVAYYLFLLCVSVCLCFGGSMMGTLFAMSVASSWKKKKRLTTATMSSFFVVVSFLCF